MKKARDLGAYRTATFQMEDSGLLVLVASEKGNGSFSVGAFTWKDGVLKLFERHDNFPGLGEGYQEDEALYLLGAEGRRLAGREILSDNPLTDALGRQFPGIVNLKDGQIRQALVTRAIEDGLAAGNRIPRCIL